jgi:predicted glutamine amidotransferase
MCRLYGFIATEPTKVECSLARAQNALLRQSRLDSRGRSHPDGWGIAYYADNGPMVERRSTAAYDDLRFLTAAEQVRARVIVARVRAASVGAPSTANTHPFSMGRWVFAHNGTVPRLERIGPMFESFVAEAGLHDYRRGTTDSELTFLWILSRVRQLAPGGLENDVPLEGILSATRDCILAIERSCRGATSADSPGLNFVLTDGRCLVASRHGQSAYWVVREDVGRCEVCRVCHCSACTSDSECHHERRPGYRAAMVASEPITEESWEEIPERHLLAVDHGVERVDVVPL